MSAKFIQDHLPVHADINVHWPEVWNYRVARDMLGMYDFKIKKSIWKYAVFPKHFPRIPQLVFVVVHAVMQSGYCLRPLISQDNKLKCRWQLLTRNANVFQHKGGFLDKLVVRSLSRSRSLFMDGDMEITKKEGLLEPYLVYISKKRSSVSW